MIHILHIRKTGGSAVGEAVGRAAAGPPVHLHGHDTRLGDIPVGEKVVFTVRDPVSRFCSGFNSRLRCGRPRNNRPWSPGEARAFERFRTPGELAEALAEPGGPAHEAARAAMADIRHLPPLSFWLHDVETLEARAHDIVMVMHQPDLAQDFETLKTILGLDRSTALPKDEVAAHRTPAGFSTQLSERGRRAVETHYAGDMPLYRRCLDIRTARTREAPGR